MCVLLYITHSSLVLLLPSVNSAAMKNIGMLSNLLYIYLEVGLVQSCSSSSFTFLSNLHTAFHSNYISFQSHQQDAKVPISPLPQQFLLFSVILIVAILSMRWDLTVVLIRISLMITNVEHLFICLLDSSIPP